MTAKDNCRARTAVLVLFSLARFSARQLALDLRRDWGIETAEEDAGEENQSLATLIDGMTAAVFLNDSPVPGGAAERDARTNYLWPGAADAAKSHRAYVTVSVQQNARSPLEAAALAVKIASSAAKQKKALGVLAAGTLMSRDFYIESAKTGCEGGRIPVMNLVYIGLYSLDGGKTMNAYTNGLAALGSLEVEALGSRREPGELFSLMADAATLQLERPGVLKDGVTFALPGGPECRVSLEKGQAAPGMALRIAF